MHERADKVGKASYQHGQAADAGRSTSKCMLLWIV